MASVPTLGYWDIRGNTEAIRQILHYAGIQFNDKRYTVRDDWFNEKFTLGLDFPNLPYFLHNDLKLTQSTAILRYVARLAKLVPNEEKERAKVEMLEQQIIDLRVALTSVCYNAEKFDQLKPEFVKSIPDRLKPFAQYLGTRKYLAESDQLTYVDFVLADVLSIYASFEPTALNGFPTLASYVERIESLPKVAEYLKSGVYHKFPYNGPIAVWGNKRE